MPNSAFGAPAGNVHQEYAHNVEIGDPLAIEQMTNYNVRHANHVLALLDLLASVPEDNGTLLDSTLVVWANEMANGSHRQDPYPMVLFGGSNLPLRWGQYLYWPSNGPTPVGTNNHNSMKPSGYAHNHVLVSLAQTMGLDFDAIGDTSVAGADGTSIDCTGRVDRMMV